MIPFAIGGEYPRAELLAFVGSKQQMSGVIWGAKEPGCLIVTSGGRHSVRAGYSDKVQGDGSWIYFGQGEVGDHDPARYANRTLIEADKTILLFSTREVTSSEARAQGNHAKRYRYAGAYQVGEHEVIVPKEGPRTGNRLLKFTLVPVLDDISRSGMTQGVVAGDLHALRRQLLTNDRSIDKERFSISAYRKRSEKVRAYALVRSAGICEGCNGLAPFKNELQQPFLEVHHMLRLADDGPDIPENVAALCPNCHRKVHFSSEKNEFHQLLMERIRGIEAELSRVG